MSLPFSVSRFLLASLLLGGCTEQPDLAVQPSAKALAARQELIQGLAVHIRYYHEDDLKASKPGWDGGGIYGFTFVAGRKGKLYHGRAAVRAELNRMLDSLKATGPLRMGNREDDTDTIPGPPGPFEPGTAITSTNTSTVTSWVPGDSAATVRTRKVHSDSTGAP